MAAKSAHYNGSNDGMMVIFIVIAALGLLLAVLWFSFHTFLSWIAIKCAWSTLPLLDAAVTLAKTHSIPSGVTSYLIPESIVDDIESLKYWLPRTDPSQVKFGYFVNLLEIFGYGVRLFSPLIALAGVAYVWKRSKAARLSRVMNIFTLARNTMCQFPQVRPAIIEKLLKVDPDRGHFRREESPMRFAVKHGLLEAYKIDFKQNLLPETVTPTFDKSNKKKDGFEFIQDNYAKGIAKLHNRCILDSDKAEQVFIEQLGSPWTGSDGLPPMIRGLYAALISFAAGDKEASFAILDQYNRSWKPPKKTKTIAILDVSGVDELIAKYEHTQRIQKLISSHGYATTVMARLLQAAREKGRLGTSLFLWLKVVDRVLWYSLNQEGGQCGWTEAAGPRAHKIAELSVGGPLHKPYVKTAVLEFESYLRDKEGWLPSVEDLPKFNGA